MAMSVPAPTTGRREDVMPQASSSRLARASSLISTISQLSMGRSRQALHTAGSFLGLTEEDSNLELWRDRTTKRARSGAIGLHLSTIVSKKDKAAESLEHLSTTLERSENVLRAYANGDTLDEQSMNILSSLNNLDENRTENTDSTKSSAPIFYPGVTKRLEEEEKFRYVSPTDSPDCEPHDNSLSKPVSHSSLISEEEVDAFFGSALFRESEMDKADNISLGEVVIQDSDAVDLKCQSDSDFLDVTPNRTTSVQSAGPSLSYLSMPCDTVQHCTSPDDANDTIDGNQANIQVVSELPLSQKGTSTKDAMDTNPLKVTNELGPFLDTVDSSQENLQIPDSSKSDASLGSKPLNPAVLYRKLLDVQRHKSDSTMSRRKPHGPLRLPTSAMSNQSHAYGVRHRHSVTFNPLVTEVISREQTQSSHLKGSPQSSEEKIGVEAVHLADEEQLLHGAAALEHYQHFIQLENDRKMFQLTERKDFLIEKLDSEIQGVDDALSMAQAYYYGTYDQQKSTWLKIKQAFRKLNPSNEHGVNSALELSENLHLQRQKEELPIYKPRLVYVIIAIQICLLVACCFLGGISDIGLDPQMKIRHGVMTFEGRETVEHWVRPNIWIGPDPEFFIAFGAIFAPCMREDAGIALKYAMDGYRARLNLGCCEVRSRNTAGTTTMEECMEFTAGVGIWRVDESCSERQFIVGQVSHNMRPCCYGLKGQCKLATQEHCAFLHGHYFDHGPDHCTQVNCLSQTCGMGGLRSDSTLAYLPASPGQQWRLFIAPFLHQGIFYLILVVVLEWTVGRQIETAAGPLRLAAIFMYSGVVSLVFGAVFSPYLPHSGSGGAAFSLVGVLLVELVQSWQLLPHPWKEAAKLTGVVLLFLLSGTLPYVNNFELLTGLLTGILSAMLLLPYVTFGKWHVARRRALVVLSCPLILLFTALTFYMFYYVQALDEACETCQWINCVPYTQAMCNTTDLW